MTGPITRCKPRTYPWTPWAMLVGLLGAGVAMPADAPSGGSYVLRKQVVVAGGARSAGGDYQLTATIAQPATGPASGGSYSLQQGFHAGAASAPDPLLFNDNFESVD